MSKHYERLTSECNNSLWGDNDSRCGATIWSPSLEPHYVGDRAFSLFAMECTRQEKINKVIQLLSASSNPNDFTIQCLIYDEVGIDSDTFTSDEVRYIEEEVARRCR